MKVTTFSESQLVEAIQQGGAGRQTAIRHIYNDRQLCQKIIQFVMNNRSNESDGQDMFHEGIIVLDRNIREGKFRGESSLQGYLYSICRFLWMNQIRKNVRVNLTDDTRMLDDVSEDNPEVTLFSEEKKQLLDQMVRQLGERCRQILELWKLSYSMEEIAEQLDFSSAAMARKAKYRCHQSLLELLRDHPQITEMLKN